MVANAPPSYFASVEVVYSLGKLEGLMLDDSASPEYRRKPAWGWTGKHRDNTQTLR